MDQQTSPVRNDQRRDRWAFMLMWLSWAACLGLFVLDEYYNAPNGDGVTAAFIITTLVVVLVTMVRVADRQRRS